MSDPALPRAAASEDDGSEPLLEDAGLDWEALRANGRLHLFCYLHDQVLALALPEAVA